MPLLVQRLHDEAEPPKVEEELLRAVLKTEGSLPLSVGALQSSHIMVR